MWHSLQVNFDTANALGVPKTVCFTEDSLYKVCRIISWGAGLGVLGRLGTSSSTCLSLGQGRGQFDVGDISYTMLVQDSKMAQTAWSISYDVKACQNYILYWMPSRFSTDRYRLCQCQYARRQKNKSTPIATSVPKRLSKHERSEADSLSGHTSGRARSFQRHILKWCNITI